jgi:hypothetical protein
MEVHARSLADRGNWWDGDILARRLAGRVDAPVLSAFRIEDFNSFLWALQAAFNDRRRTCGPPGGIGLPDSPGFTAETERALEAEWARLLSLKTLNKAVFENDDFNVSVADELTSRVPTFHDAGERYLHRPSATTAYDEEKFTGRGWCKFPWLEFMFEKRVAVFDSTWGNQSWQEGSIPTSAVHEGRRAPPHQQYPRHTTAYSGSYVCGYVWERVLLETIKRGVGTDKFEPRALVSTAVQLLRLAVYDAAIVFALKSVMINSEWMRLKAVNRRKNDEARFGQVDKPIAPGSAVAFFDVDGPTLERLDKTEQDVILEWGHDFDPDSRCNIVVCVSVPGAKITNMTDVALSYLGQIDRGDLLIVNVFCRDVADTTICAYRDNVTYGTAVSEYARHVLTGNIVVLICQDKTVRSEATSIAFPK